MRTGNVSALNDVIGLIPDWPFFIVAQNGSFPMPADERIPRPVITTLLPLLSCMLTFYFWPECSVMIEIDANSYATRKV
jgi:hypothetical protein